MSQRADVIGVVLAGGLSSRMGGGDKGLRDLAGRPMLAHVIDRLRPQVGSLIINANGDPARFAAFGLPVVPDTIAGHIGPLAGILAGMRWAAANTAARWIVTVSGDAPVLPANLVAQFMAAVADRPGGIALAQSCSELHPVIGLWPITLATSLEDELARGTRKVLHWAERHSLVPVAFSPTRAGGVDIDPFFNANTPQELEQLRAMLSKTSR